MRIAYFSPLPPAASGIADYSAELLPHLAQYVDITLFFDPQQPPEPWLVEQFPAYARDRFAARRSEFDVAVYHMGNDVTYHAGIWYTLAEHPGIVVMHDVRLYHFFNELVHRGDLVTCRGNPLGMSDTRALGQVVRALNFSTLFPTRSLLNPVVHQARGVVVHSRYAAHQIAECCPGVPVVVIPHHLSLPEPFDGGVDRNSVRQRLNLADRFVVGTFGFLTEAKRLFTALRAFARLYHHWPEALYCLVGGVHPELDLNTILTRVDLPREAVRVTGRLPLEEFLSYMVATDVAINLRYPTAGETSGTLIRLLGLGVPTIVSDVGAFSEFPEGVVARVPVDGSEEETLTAILETLAEDEVLRRALGANAREYARTHHSLEASAQAYCDFIARVVAGEAQPSEGEIVSPATQVLRHVAATLAGWGVTEHRDALLEPVARAMAEMGLSGGTGETEWD
jgi:glycosyltransferase involved in cell wall biosynthesis